ncbi:hypothetical protein [Stieleria varia]|uniref:Uncharacterized protein n=1 Tax=Stieleria varia TaxID=2528005 RepID=A0A5C6B5A4_9BACT|nr:hypothetical protein [Stieleria varia]TWU07475.1 hypothetical protein Pla52n_00480 [Stieleria varia]
MPHLMVDLEDPIDCKRAMQILRRRVERDAAGGGEGRRRGRGGRGGTSRECGPEIETESGGVQSLSLPQKLKRLQQRGMWKHLVKIAKEAEQPLSLPELDTLLELPKNKMRSLKAIMAKLENRFDLKFLKVDTDAGADEAGNPRYIMPPRIRRQILRLATA